MKTKRRTKAKIENLTIKDITLLSIAYGLPDESFLCFGQSYFPLLELGLVSDESKITFMGRKYIWHLSQIEKAKKREQT